MSLPHPLPSAFSGLFRVRHIGERLKAPGPTRSLPAQLCTKNYQLLSANLLTRVCDIIIFIAVLPPSCDRAVAIAIKQVRQEESHPEEGITPTRATHKLGVSGSLAVCGNKQVLGA